MRTVILVLALSTAQAAAPIRFDLPATDGSHYSSEQAVHSRALVLVFLATDCPISNRYSPLLHQLEVQYSPGVKFLAVFSDPATPAAGARHHLAEYSLNMPGLLDPGASLARQTGARVTPEVAVLSPAGLVIYRGRIDDRYVSWGLARPEAKEHDLRDTLDAILAGKPAPHPSNSALGCAIPGL